jgi:hypothetical protein
MLNHFKNFNNKGEKTMQTEKIEQAKKEVIVLKISYGRST